VVKKSEIIENSRIKIAKRKDFYDALREPLQELLELTGASFFAHQFIDNYYQLGHFVSSFNTHEDWLDTYWSEFWDKDPIERKIHKNAKANGVTFSIWKVSDPTSSCMITRKQMCQIEDGVAFSYQHKDGLLENFTVAWKEFDVDKFDAQKVEIIQEKIIPIRLHHRQVYQDLK
jgi:hypothetical protein